MQAHQKPDLGADPVETLLAQEESCALSDLGTDLSRAGEDLVASTDLRRRIRARPMLAAALAFAGGWFGAPLVVRAVRGLSDSANSGSLAALRSSRLRDLVRSILGHDRTPN
ncbi:MAG: hypothetical protein NTV21_05685 [Planctomycetota bacterium]|nr:hypothetical protein [Planctomycetota bacterium]